MTIGDVSGPNLTSDSLQDPFNDVGAKLAALLALDQTDHVLIVGRGGWPGELGSAFASCTAVPSPWQIGTVEHRSYSLVIWRSAGDVSMRQFRAGLSRIRKSMRPDGNLLLLIQNPLALPEVRRHPGVLLRVARVSRRGVTQSLRSAGFQDVREFLVLPNAVEVEEFSRSTRSPVELPESSPSIKKLLNALGLYTSFHDGFLYMACPSGGGPSNLIDAVAGALEGVFAGATAPSLERFALRERGALMLFLRRGTTGEHVICRVTCSPEVDGVVRRNADWTRAIRENASIPAVIRARVPAPLVDLQVGTSRAYVEQLFRGAIGWKIATNAALEPILFEGVLSFIHNLAISTKSDVVFGPDLLQSLLPLPDHPWLDQEMVAELTRFRDALYVASLGQVGDLVWSHGDYGYGNVIADPRTGELRGVIDWDQARDDLSGTDLVNFLVQRERTIRRILLVPAFQSVCSRVMQTEADHHSPSQGLGDFFPQDRAHRAVCLGWALWRYVERDIRYAAGFYRGRDGFRELLHWGRQFLTEVTADRN